MTLRELRQFMDGLEAHDLDRPIYCDGFGTTWEVAAVSVSQADPQSVECQPVVLMPAHIALPTIPRTPRGAVGYDPSWWGVLGIFRARIRQAARPQLLDLMTRMNGLPPGWRDMNRDQLVAACLLQAGAWATEQAAGGDRQG